MAIMYSYPLNDDIKSSDGLVGTTKKNINGKPKIVTRNFLLSDLAGFFIIDGGIQKTITLTTNNTSGPATLNQGTGVLNIPQYEATPSALTKVDDTNIKLTLGGSPLTSLLQPVTMTLSWVGTLADSRISSASTWNAKQNALNGTGFVKSIGGTISYDNNTYYLASNPSGFTSNLGTITSITASSPLTGGVINSSGTIGITQAGSTSNGYLTSTDWTIFNNKENSVNKQNSLLVDGTGVKFPTVDAVNAGILNSQYWTKTGDDIQNNNTGKILLFGSDTNNGNPGLNIVGSNSTSYGGNTTNKAIINFIPNPLGTPSNNVVSGIQSQDLNQGNVRAGIYFQTEVGNSGRPAIVFRTGLSLTEALRIGQDGITKATSLIKYNSDLSSTYDDRTLVDKGYVTIGLSTKENLLGNPLVNGYVLSSTTSGIRSWIPMSGGGATPTLQQVTTAGATTTNPITINTTNANSLILNSSGGDFSKSALIINNSTPDGFAFKCYSYGGSVSNYFYSDSGDCISLQNDYNNGIGIFAVAQGQGIVITANNSTVAEFNQSLNNKGLVINSGTSSTGNFIELVKNGINKLTVNQSGDVTANKFVKDGGTGANVLLDNGATTPLTSIVGTTNLTTSQTSTNFTINSSTGTDATVPLGNGTLAGATLNDYTTAEKALVATIPNINTNAIEKVTVKLSESIAKGQAVYVSGANGTNILVSKASNTAEATSSKTLGLLETTGVTNDIVNVITDGLLTGLNTSTATIGDAVWLGVDGELIFWHYGQTTKPIAPAHLVYIGVVTRVSATVGEIFIKVQNGFELDEIHNVLISTPTNEDFLQYESSTSLWKNIQLTASWIKSKLDITTLSGSNTGDQDLSGLVTTSRTITINGTTQDLTADRTFTVSSSPSSQSAYTMLANNTNASAIPTEQVFKNITSQVYTGATPTWAGTTAPSGTTNHTYSWSRIGNVVMLRVSLDYATAGSGLTAVTFDLPSDCPSPELPSGVSANADVISYGSGMLTTNRNIPSTPTASYACIRIKSSGVYEINIGRSSAAAHKYAYATIQYFV